MDATVTPQTHSDAGPQPQRAMPAPKPPKPPVGLGSALRRAVIALLALLALLTTAALVVRLGVRTQAGRAAVVRAVEGMKLGPIGRLHVEGLEGDPLDRFTLRRLTIADPGGVWLDGRDLSLAWSPWDLLQRRFHARRLTVGDLLVSRRPQLEKRPPAPSQPPVVAVKLDSVAGRLRTGKALTVAAGDWDLTGAMDYRRSGRIDAQVAARSRLHAGDHLDADLRLTDTRRLSLKLDGREAAGGALAGGLGLAADQPLSLTAEGVSDDRGGRIHVDSRSGALRPLYADGRWTPQGGHVEAHALLAASTHLLPYVPRVGPQADAVLDVRRGASASAPPIADLRVAGSQTQAHAVGPMDFGRLSTPGLQVQATTVSLGAWFHPPVIGPAQVTGVAKGSIKGFTLTGQAAAQKLDEVGLTVARLTGPLSVTLADGEWRIRTQVQGEGAGGEGVLPMLLGSRPTATIDLSFLKDRRLLFRQLHVAGTYAKVDATGAQGLLGGLSFQGQAVAPDLKGMRPGAGGALTASFKASAAKNSPVWALSTEARGERFATGIAELDRLVGPTPRLTGSGVFDPVGLHVAQSELTGTAARATATGLLGVDKGLGFDLEWSAQGPFAVGPVEVAGAMTGRGRLSGTLGEPQADLTAKLASLDLGRLVVKPADLRLVFTRGATDMDGRAEVAGASNYGPAHARAAFHMGAHALALSDIDADAGGVRLAGAAALSDGEPSSADLTVVAGPGAFLATGKLSGAMRLAAAAGGAKAQITLDGRGLSLPGATYTLDRLALNADGPMDRLPYRLSAAGTAGAPFSWSGDGVLAREEAGRAGRRRLTLSGAGKVRGAKVATVEPAVVDLGPDGLSARLRLTLAGGRADVDAAQAGAAGKRRLTVQAKLSKVALEAFAQDYTGGVDATLALAGEGAALGGRLDVAISGARARDASRDLALDAEAHAELAPDRVRGSADATNAQGLKAHATFDIPAEAAADPFRIALVKTRPVIGAFAVDGELKPLWDLFGGGERTLSGRVSAQGSVSGTLNDPKAVGRAQLAKGAFQDVSTGLTLKNLDVVADLDHDAVRVSRFSGSDGRTGAISGDGSVGLAKDGRSTFALNLSRFQLIDNEIGRATASGAVTVTRDAQGRARLSGKLAIDRADISANTQSTPGVVRMDVVEVNRKNGDEDAAAVQAASASRTAALIALDVGVTASRGVFVKGRGVDAELTLDAHVGGTVARPDLTGDARFVRGSYEFSGKRFDFDEASVVRLGATPETIRLDITAERDDPSLDAKIRIRGTAARPEITLTSVPVLPQDEILSRVLFGVSASQLSPFEAAQLASALAGLATGGGFDVLGSLRQFAGLDRLTLGGAAGSGASVSGGKYLTNDLYVELTGAGVQRGENQQQLLQTGRTGSSASIEWRVRRNLSLVGQVWTGGDSRLSVRFRRTFGAARPGDAKPAPGR